MGKSLYGKKMFITDLLIASLWALFVLHFAWGRIMAPIAVDHFDFQLFLFERGNL